MGAAFSMLFAKIAAALEWFGKLYVAVFKAAWDLIRDAACWPFEQVMEIVISALQALPLDDLSNQTTSWGNLPTEMLNIMGLLGVGTAVSIIASAIGIRLVLQLIPFTRLGS